MGERLEREVLVPVIKGQGGRIVHGCFKDHGIAFGLAQPIFGSGQKFSADPLLANFGKHVNGDDVSFIAAADFRDDEAENVVRLCCVLAGGVFVAHVLKRAIMG